MYLYPVYAHDETETITLKENGKAELQNLSRTAFDCVR